MGSGSNWPTTRWSFYILILSLIRVGQAVSPAIRARLRPQLRRRDKAHGYGVLNVLNDTAELCVIAYPVIE